jgi:DNA invertase Pin-like site-specific DNA recombinase
MELRDGSEVVQDFVDRRSAKTSDREQFQRIFQAASVHLLLFWSLSRFSRERTVATLNQNKPCHLGSR